MTKCDEGRNETVSGYRSTVSMDPFSFIARRVAKAVNVLKKLALVITQPAEEEEVKQIKEKR